MLRPCPYWPDDHQCASKECGIQHCDDEVPIALRKKSSIIPAVGLIRKENNLTRDRVRRKFLKYHYFIMMRPSKLGIVGFST